MTSSTATATPITDPAEHGGLHSQILPGLYMGGTADHEWVTECNRPSSIVTKQHFDSVVTLFGWAQAASDLVVELRYSVLDASMTDIDLPRLLDASRFAYQRWQAGDRVLIRCQAGLNRSGLVTALTLMLHGFAAADAIAHIREHRSADALFNDNFVTWLLTSASGVLDTGSGS